MKNNQTEPEVVYFSLEFMLETDVPTYAGGLGVLAGDLMRSCADLGIGAIGMSIVYSGDTFSQTINADGTQSFTKQDWQKLDQLTKLPQVVELTIANTKVLVGCWRYDIVGLSGYVVPVYLLDTNLTQNPPWVREITRNLYEGGEARLAQEIVLGIGGVKMLRTLGIERAKTYHLNEGHCGFVPLALLPENNYQDELVRQMCVFTTHTPIPEGHDRFSYELAYKFGGSYLPWHIKKLAGENEMSMTHLAMNLSRKNLAVSRKHQVVSEQVFPGYKFGYVTNGVHHRSWTHNYLQDLYNQVIPGWLENPETLADAPALVPDDLLWNAHIECKKKLITYVNRHLTTALLVAGDYLFDENTLTISLARRPVAYKRPLLLYHDIERFVRIGAGRIQVIQCGKSHPDDDVSQGFVRQIVDLSKRFKEVLKIVFLENYSPKIARLLVNGSDVWLNTPKRGLEASGTSGMKAAMNGVINLSIPDGWWIEAVEIDRLAGFSIGTAGETNDDSTDADIVYEKLEMEIIPMYYENRGEWIGRMKRAIALGAYFNTHRVVKEYRQKVWRNANA
ncbi:hypothetical protein A2634_05270 [Candidatus Amesbacteria bacterium RIFCSPHIGHO2_01_FULL_48_32]|uniref:glycogen phosphorylase n=1 Tax=Candidatus Amesbacteria bacterium RIFCSPLOWO2_01_FULL_48_25 TaxID=1797259 RepID=A0A1F4ZEK5_9BACT|nr:MAG: hypothetical protein A2634_05270 [Candidatus Amesbacteria bacterium RIFCSPHIGHO2_01_FULL_48_32]OGD04077.1 MAG: hypothetical protein A2989_01615 [Candidatus Amesbacteria bacterium RIFCSPLOWO2_01_FULL_48_25]HJZ05657.1 alpha-glucan family phosphorylase [Patescibacteria group bacterium]